MKNKHIIISGIALFLITILLLGLTYAYYKTKVIGNNNEKTISSVGKKLEITYADGNGVIEAAEIEPGYTATKTFSVKNTGDDTATYSIKLDNITNTFSRTEDWTYVLKEGTAEINRGTIPTYETTLLDSIEIEAGVTKSYSLTVTYANLTDVDQSIDMGSTLSIRVNIADAVINSVTFIGNGNSIENYRIYGNSIQRGIPTPDNPVEIESVGDKTKNLINLDSVLSKAFTKNDDGTYSICKLSNAIRFSNFYYVDIPANTPITFSYELVEYNGTYMAPLQMALTFDDGTVTTIGYRHINYSETATYDKPITRVRVYQENAMPDGTCTKFKNLQLELGTSATEYEPYGYKIPVNVSGKNLFDIANYSIYKNDSNGLSYTEKDFLNIHNMPIYIGAKYDEQYTISLNYEVYSTDTIKGNGIYIKAYDENDNVLTSKTLLSKGSVESGNVVLTTPYGKTVSYFRFSYITSTRDCKVTISDVQIEKGNDSTEYEPYIEPITSDIYLDEPLRKIDDYADYIDFKEKKVVRNIKSIVLNSNMDTNKWIFADKQHGFYYYFLDNDLYKKNSRVFSNRFKSGINVPQIENSTGLYDVLYIKTTRWKEISEFKDWISSNKTSLEYILNSPIKNDIQLPNINSIEGVNVININTNINPSSIEINS